MDNQVERSSRISANSIADLPIESWLPPAIPQAKHVVHAERRSGGHGAAGFVGSGSLAGAGTKTPQAGVATVSDVEQVMEEARQQGFAAGEKDGFAKGQQEGLTKGHEEGILSGHEQGKKQALEEMALEKEGLKQQEAQLALLLGQLSESLNQQDYQLEQALLNITQVLAKAVIKQEMLIRPGHIMAAIKEVIASLPLGRDNLRVLCHPDDLPIIEQSLPQGETWQLSADQDIERGGCCITTDQSIIDYSISTRLQEAVDQVIKAQVEHLDENHPDFEAAPDPVSAVLDNSTSNSAIETVDSKEKESEEKENEGSEELTPPLTQEHEKVTEPPLELNPQVQADNETNVE